MEKNGIYELCSDIWDEKTQRYIKVNEKECCLNVCEPLISDCEKMCDPKENENCKRICSDISEACKVNCEFIKEEYEYIPKVNKGGYKNNIPQVIPQVIVYILSICVMMMGIYILIF
jgi:hypothetical protein